MLALSCRDAFANTTRTGIAVRMQPTPNEPVRHVTEGMRVVDADGADVGKVTDLKMGDPQAATAEGQETEQLGLVSVLLSSEPRVPEQQARHLLRTGYIKVDRSGLFSGHLYVSGEDIAAVSDDVVRLAFVVED